MTLRPLALPVLLLAAPAAAQPVNCADPQVQVELTWCAEQAWLRADARLNAAYPRARAVMRGIDAALPPDRRGAERSLRDAQRTWIAFRDGACDAEGWVFTGGSAQGMAIYACLERLTVQRAADLESLAAMR
ncbi:lysozyme inhibitor LprI family protein [Ruixingdingia sedimenti]|uniref:Lysozyme inhibitor LprI family protein n=1 Tax=Ruixingdingia sedimenti TaxID=3073604 RepID=A0ABU1F4X6_9RHOB|nr:lysozyme inhibitor LprI family protein [Xinfangfangia sp. LG-4]MDR5651906.1 lysozyme inhibitor LprI family protein [Xinfangfangia sp. LG-4]